MEDLSELFNKYGSDKDRNGYTQIYHTLFHKMRNEPLVMLEIGIGTMIPGVRSSMVGYSLPGYAPGGSLRAWRDFFPLGRIVGADIQLDTQFTDERIETYICDSTKFDQTEGLMNKLGVQFDIILDDGCHHDEDQFLTLKHLYSYLKPGGIYIIEDIYSGSKVTTQPERVAHYCNNDPYFFVGLKNNICVIYKEHIKSKRMNY